MTGSSLEHVAACWEGNAETWTRQAWAGYDVYRDHNNTQALIAMLPPIAGLDGIPTPDEAARVRSQHAASLRLRYLHRQTRQPNSHFRERHGLSQSATADLDARDKDPA